MASYIAGTAYSKLNAPMRNYLTLYTLKEQLKETELCAKV